MANPARLKAPGRWVRGNKDSWKRFIRRAQIHSGPTRNPISINSSCVRELEKWRRDAELATLKEFLVHGLNKLDPVLKLSIYDGAIHIRHGDVLTGD